MTYRHRAPVLNPVHSLTAEQHAEIKKQALEKTLNWSTSDGLYGALITKFRAEIKEHYYRWQRRRCCYCSTELHDHKITYDAEHILDGLAKRGQPHSRRSRQCKPPALPPVRSGICGAVVQELINNAEPVKVGDTGKVEAMKG